MWEGQKFNRFRQFGLDKTQKKYSAGTDLTLVWLQWAEWSNRSFPSLPLWWRHLHENRVIVPPRFICFPGLWHHDCLLWEALCSRLRSQWLLGEEGARAALQKQRSHFMQASPVKWDGRSDGTDAKAQNMQYRQGNSYTRNPDWPYIPFAPHNHVIQSWDLPFQNLELSLRVWTISFLGQTWALHASTEQKQLHEKCLVPFRFHAVISCYIRSVPAASCYSPWEERFGNSNGECPTQLLQWPSL